MKLHSNKPWLALAAGTAVVGTLPWLVSEFMASVLLSCLMYIALATEGVALDFLPEGITRLAHIAFDVNERTENIGARRLSTVMERLLDDVSFDAARLSGQTITVDAAYVDTRLQTLSQDEDLSRYIL